MNTFGDTTFWGEVTLNGDLNKKKIDTDSNTMIIEVCRRLDVSNVGNKIEIELPTNYVCSAFNMVDSPARFFFVSYGADSTTWTTDAVVTATYYNAQASGTAQTTNVTITNNTTGNIALTPFLVGTLTFEVTTACTGAVNPYIKIIGSLFCHKE